MDSMEEKIGSILNNPEMMQKILSMAQTLGASSPPQEPAKEAPSAPALPDIDLGMLQKISGLAQQGNIDKEQLALLRALGPYLSSQRIRKLENAMRAAKMARIAVSVLQTQGIRLQSTR